MSTLPMNEQYQSDILEVQEDIHVLHEQERRIEELEKELDHLRKDHANLKQKLLPYRIESPEDYASLEGHRSKKQAIVDTTSMHPIYQCSNDVIYLIFEHSLYTPYNHPSIRCLLLVCRRWYHLIMNSAHLWSSIVIFNPSELFDFFNKKSKLSYIRACISRSKDLPLDIQINLTSLTPHQYIADALCQYGKSITDEDQHSSLEEKIQEQDWEFSSSSFQSRVERAVECLVGPNGEHAKRYRTLFLAFPMDTDIAIQMWMKMAPHFQQLKSLLFSHFPNDWIEKQQEPPPNLPQVKRLTTWTIIPTSLLNVSPMALEYISLSTPPSLFNLEELSSFQRLTELIICCDHFSSFQEMATYTPPRFSIRLPLLHTLSLSRQYENMRGLILEFPSLDLLNVQVYKVAGKLPRVSPLRIRWQVIYWEEDAWGQKEALRDVIMLSEKIQSISVLEISKTAAELAVAECKAEGKASSLTQIMVGLKNGRTEIMNV